jgi:CheY-like chemotaxis protein
MKKSGGRLTVSLKDETITGPGQVQGRDITPGDYLKLSVADTGHGMDDTLLERLNQPAADHSKADNTLPPGLSVVQNIVDEYAGTIVIHSYPGKGTTVDIFLPRAGRAEKPRSDTPAPPEPEATAQNTGKTIMLVDDEKAIRQIYEEFLKGHGYDMRLFENGAEALNAFEADPEGVDLVVTDMTMPELTGDRLAAKMLKIRPDIPIVMWCGFSEDISEDTAIQMGIKKYIQKPVSPRELLQEIRQILDEH